MSERFWHGGAPGLRVGDIIEPRPNGDTSHLVDDCPTCEARRAGNPLTDDDNDSGLIYVTTDRNYARVYAAGYPRGALYRVEPIGEAVDRSEHDPAPSWGYPSARVLAVYDACVTMTPAQMRREQKRFSSPVGIR
ncbi:hypothetical protein CH276_14110 [Rhodococcus sp. 06-470-2]|uniref:hypothetical protein n=1 Tax=unclassified Rhodococcus (in: high G+C Gram-positive bacteria) TaxID=192944 RepID=UPI000B9C1544|nr:MULTISPECIES: hypothetical protein [unclassified Rhodococcus (in: high G+C Gram-positive bacteria)]OZC62750.1 hypothetical protein CH276_14110 [Rhodococcus sp. 06-470-2]OZE71727.1 hypothetical protein CH265_01590 [Rhodococcus sp. 05-2221-1B]